MTKQYKRCAICRKKIPNWYINIARDGYNRLICDDCASK